LISIDSSQLAQFPQFIVANTVALMTFGLLLFITLTFIIKDFRQFGAVYFSSMEGNTVYLGFPIILGLLGQVQLNYAVIYIATAGQIASLFNAFLITTKKGNKLSFKGIFIDLLKNPFIVSTLIGLAVYLLIQIARSTIPANYLYEISGISGAVSDAITKLGSITSPLALFSLGIYMYSNFKMNTIKFSFLAALIKLIIMPLAVMIFVVYFFPLEKSAAQTSIVISIVPTAVFAVMVSDIYGYDKNQTSNSLIVSSLLFLITLPAWLYVLQNFVLK